MLTEKVEKRKLNSASYMIACKFLQEMHKLKLFTRPPSQDTLEKYSFNLVNSRCIIVI